MQAIETRFLEGLLRNSWQAAVLVGIVLGVQAVMGRRLTAFWRHALWWVVVVRLLVPAVGDSRYSVFAPFVPHAPPVPRSSQVATAPAAGLAVSPTEGRSATVRESDPGATRAGPSPTVGPSGAAAPTPSVLPVAPVDGDRLGTEASYGKAGSGVPRGNTPEGARPRGWARGGHGWIDPVTAAGWIWMAGVCVSTVRIVVQNLRFAVRLRRCGVPVGAEARALFDECRERMRFRGRVRLIRCSWLGSPAVYGVWRPAVLLPARLEDEFPPEALRHVFLHELAHLRRWDLVTNVVVEVAGILHWFNPAVGLARARMRHDLELAADALALSVVAEGEARAYGRTILRVLEGWVKPVGRLATVGILGDPRQIEGRVRAIAAYRRPEPTARLGGFVMAGLMVVAMTDQADEDRGASEPSVLLEARWVGWKSLAGRNDTGRLPEILGLPETVRLKAALAGRLAEMAAGTTGRPGMSAAAWRPVIEAAMDHESLLEVLGDGSGVTGWAVGVRVGDAERRELREAWSRWTGGAAKGPYRASSRDMPGWWVVGVGAGATDAVVQRVRTLGAGALLDPGVVWEGSGDLARVMPRLDATWKPPGPVDEWPRVRCRVEVSRGALKSRAILAYAQVWDRELPAWQVPTNWVKDPLVSFAAIRGSDRWFDGRRNPATPKPGGRRDQVFEWSLAGPPWLQYFAAPMDDPRGWMAGMTDADVVDWFGSFGVPVGQAEVRRTPDGAGLTLTGLPYFQPGLVGGTIGGRSMLAGGLFSLPKNGDPLPQAMIDTWHDRPDLVAYAWETTGRYASIERASEVGTRSGKRPHAIGRLVQLKEMEQFRRLMARRQGWKSALGAEGQVLVPGGDWIDAVSGLLGDTVTEVTRTGPFELTWVRRSQTGANAEEWMRLLRWLGEDRSGR